MSINKLWYIKGTLCSQYIIFQKYLVPWNVYNEERGKKNKNRMEAIICQHNQIYDFKELLSVTSDYFWPMEL